MVDRVDKALRKLEPKRRAAFAQLLARIVSGNLKGLDVVKLKGRSDVYRVRKGDYRIIFKMTADEGVSIIAFEHRSDSTYTTLP